jgi:hypothetical protein
MPRRASVLPTPHDADGAERRLQARRPTSRGCLALKWNQRAEAWIAQVETAPDHNPENDVRVNRFANAHMRLNGATEITRN